MNEFNIEIIDKKNDVTYSVPEVKFPAYEEYKENAEAVAEYISSIVVTEDSIKETKQTLAKARKLTDRLSRLRIDMKKDILKNYSVFEDQVKEITGIIDEADKKLRSKVRELEEAERVAKAEEIRELWNKHVSAFTILEAVIPNAFERWITPQHLNKTMSMKNVESDMSEWIYKTLRDIDTATSMGEEYLAEYSRQGDLAEAIRIVNDRESTAEAIKNIVSDTNTTPKATFIVYGNKDISLTERILKENEINYIRKDS